MSRAVRLRAGALEATIEPDPGGVLSSLRYRSVELLYQAPWKPAPPPPAPQDERSWVEAWQGGWNALFPSAGTSSIVAGREHPFHGDGSVLPWDVLAADATAVRLAFLDRDGLAIERVISVGPGSIVTASVVANHSTQPQPFVLVEHLILGEALLGPTATVEMTAGPLVPLTDDGPPLGSPDRCAAWPHVDRGAGVEDWSRRPVAPAARYGVLPRPAAGVTLTAPDAGLTLRLSWSASLPSLWFWEEAGATATAPWDGRVRCLGLEPSACATGEGLARAVERGDAVVLAPGAVWEAEVCLAVGPLAP